MQTAFEEYTKKDNTKVKYYDLIIPQGISTTYWMASRCVGTHSDFCNFYVRYVDSGRVYAYDMSNSNGNSGYGSLALFPVITLSSKLIKSGTDGAFEVSLDKSSKLK